MIFNYSAFEIAYRRKIPSPLKALYENNELLKMAPVLSKFPDKPFVVEIQYFLTITKLVEQDIEHHRFTFAVNFDGLDMLVDLTEDDLPILQRENGDVDYIGVTLVELLGASHHRAGRGDVNT